MQFPDIDPVLFQFGPFSLNFYSLSYMLGVIIGLYYAKYLCARFKLPISYTQQEQFVVWAILAILIGGRLGYVLLYDPMKYLQNPISILKTYEGGMSFHGALIALIVASYLFCRKNKIPFLVLGDVLSIISPIGICLGRIANFFNGELYGRVTDMPWGVIFPYAGNFPRHPSQLYESFLEGFVLFVIMYYCAHNRMMLKRPGACAGIFLICYACFRMVIEYFRQPDMQLGFFFSVITMGQILSLPMLLIGGVLYARATKKSS